MTLKEKIGQMFIVGVDDYNGELTNDCLDTISEYKLGNFIYMGANVGTPYQVVNLSRYLQQLVNDVVGIPAFISIDQEGGMVQRMEVGATHFLGNMALAATNNPENAYLVGAAAGMELINYGINVDFAPVLDVNNNPNNPIINVRSYSDDAAKVSVFGRRMLEGLISSGVMACAKHFPGHGDTSVDSHTDLPIIYHNQTRLNEIELLPFKNAISNGIDAIMTTHIIFSEIDNVNPATLSNAVLTGLLRNRLGFDGLIITDGLGMGAIANNYWSYSEVGMLAVKAGVDILTFTTYNGDVLDAYNGILNAVNNNEILESRINESVKRILLKKVKYGLFKNAVPNIDNASKTFVEHIALNESLAKKSLTRVKGDFTKLDPTKSTLVISPKSPRYSINSFAESVVQKLESNNFIKQDFRIINDSMKSKDITALINAAKGYDQVVIATYNANSLIGDLVTRLYSDNNGLVVISMRNPYDILKYPTVKNYFCAYDYTQVVIQTVGDFLNGDFIPTGTLPVNFLN